MYFQDNNRNMIHNFQCTNGPLTKKRQHPIDISNENHTRLGELKTHVACCCYFQMLYKLQNLLYKMQNAAVFYIAPQYNMKLSYAISPFGVLQSCPEIIEHSKTE